MEFNFPLLSAAFSAGIIIALVISCVVWMRRPSPGSLPFSMFALVIAEWLFARALETGAVNFADKVFWGKVEYFGIVSISIFWFSFALDYTGITWWRKPRNFALLCIVPFITLIMVWTNQFHGQFWSAIYPSDGAGSKLVWEHGPWFWVFVGYQYAVVLAGMLLLARFAVRRKGIYRRQLIAIFIGLLIPLIGNAVHWVGLSPVDEMDLTPFVLLLSGIIYAVSIFPLHFPDVIPVARGALVENLPDGIIVLDGEGRIVDMNPFSESITGLKRTEVRGSRIEKAWSSWPSGIRPGSESGGHAEITVEKCGLQQYLDISVTPLNNKKLKISGSLVLVRDITERNLTQRKLERLYSEEQRLSASLQEEIDKRSKYTRALVHELKTPLTAIMASGEILESEVKDRILSALVQNIRRATLNLEQRINELIDLARGEIGMLWIDPVPLDMVRLALEIAAEMGPVASAKGLKLVSDLPGPLPPVWGDKSRLRQVLINLLSNSIKYTARGTVTLRAGKYNDKFLLMQVEDTGRGIGSEQLEHLFNPYQRKNPDNERLGGLGIGLALSKIFVDLHHGQIWAESTPGKGTVLSFTIPFAPERAGEYTSMLRK